MSAETAHYYAQRFVLPALLKAIGLAGHLQPIENRASNPIAEALDIVGGVDFWVRTSDRRLITIASRVQWWLPDGLDRRSFTLRLGRGREAHKRVLAIKEGGLLPDWTAQGYISPQGFLVCAGIITTRELFNAFAAAAADPRFTVRRNSYDRIPFWPGYWKTLRRYGNATTLHTIGDVA